MEFHIAITGSSPDLNAVDTAIREVDPAALVDIDPTGATLRVVASVPVNELAALISQAGYPVVQQQVVQQPSTCCGGCSG